jgi:hypothetical protein
VRVWYDRDALLRPHHESGYSQVVEREPVDSEKPTEDKCEQAQDRAKL